MFSRWKMQQLLEHHTWEELRHIWEAALHAKRRPAWIGRPKTREVKENGESARAKQRVKWDGEESDVMERLMQGECDDFLLIFFEGMITARFRKTKVVEKVRKEMYFLFKNFFFFFSLRECILPFPWWWIIISTDSIYLLPSTSPFSSSQRPFLPSCPFLASF